MHGCMNTDKKKIVMSIELTIFFLWYAVVKKKNVYTTYCNNDELNSLLINKTDVMPIVLLK